MLKSWKTTLVGILTGAGYLFFSAMQQGLKFKDALIATGVALLGMVSKDHNVTGT